MNVLVTTVRKELASYFFSPVAYVVAVLFYLLRGFEVDAWVRQTSALSLDVDLFTSRYIFLQSTFLMIVLVPPLLSMRCFAEERRTGSLEVLLTAPVRDVHVVLGKWLAALIFFAVLWLPTALLLWVLSWSPYLGAALPFGATFASYVGLFLLGAMLLAMGVFTSSMTDNQLLASLSGLIGGLALLTWPQVLSSRADLQQLAAESPFLRTLFEQLNVTDHLANWFTRGLIDTSQVAFYLGGTGFFLFLTVKALESRKWR